MVDTAHVFSHGRSVARSALRVLESPATRGDSLVARIEPGRVVELSGLVEGACARLSTAIAIVRHVQAEGDTAAWIQPEGGPLYPPDIAEAGVDLEALVVVHIPLTAKLSPKVAFAHGLSKAAELLLRSGAFGLVVVDGTSTTWPSAPTQAWLGRVLGLARQHGSRVLLLTEKPAHADSLGTLVGLRVESHRRRESNGGFVVEHHVVKNKSGSPFDVEVDRYRGPDGTDPLSTP
jgi:recombination protein RecA